MTNLKQAIEQAKESGTPKFRIAHAVGVSEGTLANWAAGETRPDIEQARKLAEFLEVSVDDLFPEAKE